MQSSIIGKVEKARVYARERHRMHVDQLRVAFKGENSDHEVTLVDDKWSCTCDFFHAWEVCSHTMALERVLEGMVPTQRVPVMASA